MMEWQDIATAPLDGAWILLKGGETDEDDYCYKEVGVKKLAQWLPFT